MRLVLPLLLLGSGAWAKCPTASDLVGGIRLSWSNDHVATGTVQATDDPAILLVRTDWQSGDHAVRRFVWGLWRLDTVEISSSENLTSTDYGLPSSGFPRPTPETRVTFREVRYYGGPYPPAFREVYHLGPISTVTLAGCSYRTVSVTLEQTDLMVPDDISADDQRRAPHVVFEGTYLVDLGFLLELVTPRSGLALDDLRSIEAVRANDPTP